MIKDRYQIGGFDVLQAIAASLNTVLILGETGTGKEILARTIHSLSPHSHLRFVSVNCAALPEHELEYELFGGKAGTVPRATKDWLGRFASDICGTLFLDEMSEISQAVQGKLLRVLHEGTYIPAGAINAEITSVRLIVGINTDFVEQVRKGLFLEDLYNCINETSIELPPLRRRKEEIPFMVEQFIKADNRRLQKNILGVTPEALSLIMAYDWPGNTKQLGNAIEWACFHCISGQIGRGHLPAYLTSNAMTADTYFEGA